MRPLLVVKLFVVWWPTLATFSPNGVTCYFSHNLSNPLVILELDNNVQSYMYHTSKEDNWQSFMCVWLMLVMGVQFKSVEIGYEYKSNYMYNLTDWKANELITYYWYKTQVLESYQQMTYVGFLHIFFYVSSSIRPTHLFKINLAYGYFLACMYMYISLA